MMLAKGAVCAWCNKNSEGRVVCFRCGGAPALVSYALSATMKIKICVWCETSRPQVDVSHGICSACDEEHFGGGRKPWQK